MKRKVHRAFVEETKCLGASESAWHAYCSVSGEYGFGACECFNQPGESVIDRAVQYLRDECDADHVL